MDGVLIAGVALVVGLPLAAAAVVRLAACVPAGELDGAAGETMPRPVLPWWIARTWLLHGLALPAVMLTGVTSPTPTIAWWSGAGPFASVHFGHLPLGDAIVAAIVMLAMAAAHALRPRPWTAGLTIVGFTTWWMVGFGVLRVAAPDVHEVCSSAWPSRVGVRRNSP